MNPPIPLKGGQDIEFDINSIVYESCVLSSPLGDKRGL